MGVKCSETEARRVMRDSGGMNWWSANVMWVQLLGLEEVLVLMKLKLLWLNQSVLVRTGAGWAG